MKSEIECECVKRLLLELGKTSNSFCLESLEPPSPDIKVLWSDGRIDIVEVTEVHPDEVPSSGSAIRADENRRAKRDSRKIVAYWPSTNAIHSIKHRVDEKVKKANNYTVGSRETLYLLLVGALAEPGAVAATFVLGQFLNVDMLNRELNASLCNSRFEGAYLHLQLSHALWKWNRADGWHVLRAPQFACDGLSTLKMLKENAGSSILPGTKIMGSWP